MAGKVGKDSYKLYKVQIFYYIENRVLCKSFWRKCTVIFAMI